MSMGLVWRNEGSALHVQCRCARVSKWPRRWWEGTEKGIRLAHTIEDWYLDTSVCTSGRSSKPLKVLYIYDDVITRVLPILVNLSRLTPPYAKPLMSRSSTFALY